MAEDYTKLESRRDSDFITFLGEMPGELVFMDTDSLFVREYCAPPIEVVIEKSPETSAFEIGQPVIYPVSDENTVFIGIVINFGFDESTVWLQLWNAKDIFEFAEKNAGKPLEDMEVQFEGPYEIKKVYLKKISASQTFLSRGGS
jgi:hypothetical protein